MEFISNNQWVIPLFLFSIIAIIGIILGVKDIRREKGIRRQVQKLGLFTGTQEDIEEVTNIPAFFLLSPQGNHVRFLRIRNIIKGRYSDIDFVLFDYLSTFSQERTNVETILAFPLPIEDVPDFTLSPLNKLFSIHKYVLEQVIKRQLQIDDTRGKQIKFASKPEFSEKYVLFSRDEKAVRKLFDENTLKLLLKLSSDGWYIVSENGWMNLCRKDKTVKPERLHDFLKKAKLIYETILRK